MEFCGVNCGEPAKGQCARCKEFVCYTHKYEPPRLIGYIFDRPYGADKYVLCSGCFIKHINVEIPRAVALLRRRYSGSTEQVTCGFMQDYCTSWRDHNNHGYPIGRKIIASLIGSEPEWLCDDAEKTLIRLIVHVAEIRHISPPLLMARHTTSEQVRTGIFKARYERRVVVHAEHQICAWSVIVPDEREWLLLLGRYGAVHKPIWRQEPGGGISVPTAHDLEQFAREAQVLNERPVHIPYLPREAFMPLSRLLATLLV